MSKYDKVIDLALRRSFFFPAAEIYNGPAGYYDFGPVGTSLKRNFIDLWRKNLVKRDGMIEIDGSLTLPETVFKASGHLSNLVDPVVSCKKCKSFFRADKLLEEKLKKTIPENLPEKEYDKLLKRNKITCPNCHSQLTETKKTSLMFLFNAGPATKSDIIALRPETCQNIFIDFARLHKTTRIKLPIGVAQVGKSFRNEISPRQSLLRQREFAQAEIEVFFHPAREFPRFNEIKKTKLKLLPLGSSKIQEIAAEDAIKKKIISHKLIAYYLALLQQFYEKIGLRSLRLRQLSNEEKAFYAKEAWDFEVHSEDLGWVELVACNYRGDYDINSHAKGSKQDLSVLDNEEKVVPHVFELSLGIDRSIYMLLEQAYHEETVKGEQRTVLKLDPWLSPADLGVFPLVSKDGLPEFAKKVLEEVHWYDTFYDESGSIGKRYRRADEIGIPFCITIDYDSLKKKDVTIRDRDTMKQVRVKIKELNNYLYKKYY